MAERQTFGKRIEITGKGKLRIISGDTEIIIEETADPKGERGKGKKEVELEFPKGTISSLRPVLRSVFGVLSEEEGYWDQIDAMATMSPDEAVEKLKEAGIGCGEISKMLVITDPILYQNIKFGELKQEQVNDLISKVSSALEPLFGSSRPKNSGK
jgi:hypothetical protein